MNNHSLRRLRAVVCALAVLVLCPVICAQTAAIGKRPITHRDYSTWRSIHNPKLSPDGKFAVYALFPQEGDGELVIRNLATGAETREALGVRPEPPKSNPLAEVNPGEGGGSAERGITISFSPDSRFVAASTTPPKAELDKAKREKKKAEDMPRAGMILFELASGRATRVARVKSFQVPENSSAWLAYLKEPEPKATVSKESEHPPEANAAATAREEVQKESDKPGARKEFGSDLVLRNLATGAERVLPEVTEYSLSKNGSLLVFATSSRTKEETNGVYVVSTASADAPRMVLAGKGRYRRLTWDEKQSQLAFLSDRDDQLSKPATYAVYRWDTKAASAVAVVTVGNAGLQKDYAPSEKGSLQFARDGKRLFFGVAPRQPEKPKNELLDAEKVSADLWSWKDDNIQSMQKSGAEAEANRTYRSVCHLDSNKVVQLADPALAEVSVSEDGLWAAGYDNRAYRPMIEHGVRLSDWYLVNTVTGDRKPILKKEFGRLQWSPDGKYLIQYNGKDWISYSVPGLTRVNLTEKLGVSFADEEDDHPDIPGDYGLGNWTRDGKYVLLYERYDIWLVSPDGKTARNLTRIGRPEKLQFRYVRVNNDSKDPDDRWIDPAKPLLLRAENEETRDTGFFRASIKSTDVPAKLVMAAKSFSTPQKAKESDVLMFTASRFDEYPDLQVSDLDFRSPSKISEANPQKAQLRWGTAELVSYRSADGVPLKAVLYKPENFDPKKKYPMLVYIYEKLTQNLNQFIDPRPSQNINFSYYVSNGYLVLTPDITYTVGHPGQSALKCVLAAIDAVEDLGFVDRNAIGIQGHSWGGYQISYMVTQTNRFRAAAAGAPVSNMFSAYNGIRWGSGLPRQFQYEHTQSRIGGTPWEYPLRYIENSPIFAADRVQTPLMILHNDADDMVPWYQGIEYFLALRRLGKEVYMFSYNGEPHGIRKRANQKDYTVRLQQYFDHYLKGAPRPKWMEKGVAYLNREEEKVRIRAEAYGPMQDPKAPVTAQEKPGPEKSAGTAQ